MVERLEAAGLSAPAAVHNSKWRWGGLPLSGWLVVVGLFLAMLIGLHRRVGSRLPPCTRCPQSAVSTAGRIVAFQAPSTGGRRGFPRHLAEGQGVGDPDTIYYFLLPGEGVIAQ